MKATVVALLILILPLTNIFAQRNVLTLDTYKKNDSLKSYKNILVTGEGNMQARMYLQNISESLNKALKQRHINAHYEFLGDYHKMNTDEVFERVKTEGYDAVVRIIPALTKEEIQNRTPRALKYVDIFGFGRNQVTSYSRYRHNFDTNFDLVLKEKSDSTVWAGYLETNLDPQYSSTFKAISDKIIFSFIENFIISYQ